LLEDGAAVEGNNVDFFTSLEFWRPTALFQVVRLLTSAHLLGNHDDTGSPGCAPNSRHAEELDEAREHVVRNFEAGFLDHDDLLLEQSVDIVQVTRSLEGGVSETEEGFPGLVVLALLEEPTGGFRAEPGSEDERHGGDKGGGELETPGDITGLTDSEISAGSEEDA
jgi:hypothetical protein